LALAVNPVTNKIYVANGSGNVTVIDGATNATDTVPTGNFPRAVAVNPVTNKIYIGNEGTDNVTVIDGVVRLTGRGVRPGTFVRALVTGSSTHDLTATIL
jgi:YVTN family beta-propeller protein